MKTLAALSGALLLLGIFTLGPGLLNPASAEDRSVTTVPVDRSQLDPDTLSEADWKAILTAHEFHILRKKGTERAFSGEYWDSHAEGTYVCGGCGEPLFSSKHKFESGTGWPSFFQPIGEGKVETRVDRALGMQRVEILCARCGGHLGHVFPDGPQPTGDRYCVNSASLDLVMVPPAAE